MRRLRREVAPGVRIPDWYGEAYVDYARQYLVCYPIPLNWLVSVWRAVLFRLKRGILRDYENRVFQRGRSEGWAAGTERGRGDGFQAGYEEGRKQGVEQGIRAVVLWARSQKKDADDAR